MFKKIFKWRWIIMSGLCFLLLKTLSPAFIELHYSKGFFLLVRKFFDNTLGKLPFPSYYLFAALIVIIIIKWVLHFFREKPQPFLQRLFKIFSFAGFMTTLFFILWGFNYGRIPLSKNLQFNVLPLSMEQLMYETSTTIVHLAEIRNKIKKDTTPIPEIVFINNLEENSRVALNHSLEDFKYSASNVRGRILFEDVFLVFNVGGQYLPFVGEGNVDDAVFYSKKPFYVMHEMAHGNGFTDESECNFLAYVSCIRSNNLSLQYSGELNYLLYLLSEIRSRDENTCMAVQVNMPLPIRKDLLEIREYYKKHTFKTAFIGEAINNMYLKIMGVQEGTKNYDKMVLLIYAWKNKV